MSYEERQKANKIRLAKLGTNHGESIKRQRLSEMRRLESLPTRSWLEEGNLASLKKKLGK